MMTATRKIKVAYLLRTLALAGAEHYVVEMATRLDRQRFEPRIYCIAGGGALQAEAERQGVPVAAFQGSPAYNPFVPTPSPYWYAKKFIALCRYLKREQPDVVHCCMYAPSLYGSVAAKLTGHAAVLSNQVRLGAFKEHRWYYQPLENGINRLVDVVLVNSEAVKNDVLRRERIDANKLHVIYHGVDNERFMPVDGQPERQAWREETRAAFGIPPHASVVGVIGNLFAHKGYYEFIRAAAEVSRAHPDARFLCIGEDRGTQGDFASFAQKLGVQAQVIFTGQAPRVEKMLAALDIQVSASHEEGFSNAILEGMASGKPVIATNVGGNPEAVLHEQTGLIVPPKDPGALARAITTLIEHPERAAQFGKNGRKRVERYFTNTTMMNSLENLYLALLEKRQAHRMQALAQCP